MNFRNIPLSGLWPLGVMLLMGACSSGPVVIPENLSAAELIQRGQEASDRNRYGLSLQYYEAILDRFNDLSDICAAEYEIAFIHYKQGKYEQSRREFDLLLLRYETPDAELLPPQFKILANKVLERMTEKEQELNFFQKIGKKIKEIQEKDKLSKEEKTSEEGASSEGPSP